MILTLKELANHLRVNERTILRMQKSGQIKGIKIGGQWRFNGSQIDSLFFPESPLEASSDIVPLSEFTRNPVAVPISRLLRPDRMLLEMTAATAGEAIDELVEIVKRRNLSMEPHDLRDAIHARENLLSTAVGRGVAIPHPRDPVPNLAEPSVVIVGRSAKGIDFGAPDRRPVSLVFLIASQTVQGHLSVLGRLAHLFGQCQTATLLKAGTPEDFIREILRAERDDFLPQS